MNRDGRGDPTDLGNKNRQLSSYSSQFHSWNWIRCVYMEDKSGNHKVGEVASPLPHAGSLLFLCHYHFLLFSVHCHHGVLGCQQCQQLHWSFSAFSQVSCLMLWRRHWTEKKAPHSMRQFKSLIHVRSFLGNPKWWQRSWVARDILVLFLQYLFMWNHYCAFWGDDLLYI